jgi:site-specific recombinase XerD
MPTDLIRIEATGANLPALFAPSERAQQRFIEFFTANIRNPNTRRAYLRAAREFAAWCADMQLGGLPDIEPVHVAAYVEGLQARLAAPSVKQHLAAIRMLFDYLVTGGVLAANPASPVRGPKYSVKRGKTPVLTAEETRAILDAIDITTPLGLRDRALIALMVFSFARVGAAIKMRVEDVYVQGRRLWVRLHEKGGKLHEMPAHHLLEEYLHAYIDGVGLALQPKAWLFGTARARTRVIDSSKPMSQGDAYRMIGRRVLAAGIGTRAGNHSFRATGITAYLSNGGKLEIAQAMANHESARTTGLYDRRGDQVNLDEVERIVI